MPWKYALDQEGPGYQVMTHVVRPKEQLVRANVVESCVDLMLGRGAMRETKLARRWPGTSVVLAGRNPIDRSLRVRMPCGPEGLFQCRLPVRVREVDGLIA